MTKKETKDLEKQSRDFKKRVQAQERIFFDNLRDVSKVTAFLKDIQILTPSLNTENADKAHKVINRLISNPLDLFLPVKKEEIPNGIKVEKTEDIKQDDI